MKFIKDKWLTFIIIFFIVILLRLQDLSLLKWLQGLNRQPPANMGVWLSVPLPPRPPSAQCKPPASSTGGQLATGPASSLGPHRPADGAASFSALGEFWACILICLKARSDSEQLKEARPLRWDHHQQRSPETESVQCQSTGQCHGRCDTGTLKNWWENQSTKQKGNTCF